MRARALRRAAIVACILGVPTFAACRGDASREPIATANETLQSLGLPTVTSGRLATDTVWHVMIDSSTTERQLVLVHTVAALTLPDGPFELLAPLTYFVFRDSAWYQETQQRGGLNMSLPVVANLVTDLTDTSRVYFYAARAVALTDTANRADATMTLAARIQRAVRGITTDVANWRRKGFIGADAEP